MADYTGTTCMYDKDEHLSFIFPYWGEEVILTFPQLEARDKGSGNSLSPISQTLLLYYFFHADATSLSERWISFGELPDGRFYNQAFQGYTGNELGTFFKNDLDRFELAARKLSGKREHAGDIAFSFLALPRVPLLVVAWQGDDEFPASYKILFDASASHYLPPDAYAILGSHLAYRLMAKS